MRIRDQEANRLRVLKAVRRTEPVARTELSRATGMSSQAMSDLVAELLRRDLLIETKAPVAGRGRPRVELRINPQAAHVVGAFLLPRGELLVEIANLRGDRLFGRSFDVGRPQTLHALAVKLADALAEAIATGPVPKSALHSVGLGLPAVLDTVEGIVHWLPGYPEGPTRFAEMVGRRLGLPVHIDSSGDLLTRAEHWFGTERQVDDFSLIFIGPGIGLGQYVDGMLRAGGTGLTSSFAHMKVTAGDGPACVCGARGCLMTFASMSGLVGRIAERLGRAPPPFERLSETFTSFAEQARAGRSEALEGFEVAGRSLGLATANYINVWDPSRIEVAVADPTLAELISPSFRQALRANTLPVLRGRAPVSIAPVDEINFAKGAAALVLEQLYRAEPGAAAREPAERRP